MSKRFIDTGLFDDDWFMDLGKDAKLLWIYFITKCDHAGILHLNFKLCQLQTGIKNINTVRQQLGNRIITVKEQLYFIPKYVEYQYPGFPNCKFQMAKSAISILEKYGLIKDSQLTVSIELDNSISNINGNGNSNGNRGIVKGDFKIPTIEEVKAYCDERKNNVNVTRWFNFYEAKGWMIGKNKMKNWKAAVRTWENNETKAEDKFDKLERLKKETYGE